MQFAYSLKPFDLQEMRQRVLSIGAVDSDNALGKMKFALQEYFFLVNSFSKEHSYYLIFNIAENIIEKSPSAACSLLGTIKITFLLKYAKTIGLEFKEDKPKKQERECVKKRLLTKLSLN